jgi:hypothetical protein
MERAIILGRFWRAASLEIGLLRLRFDITFQLREYADILLTEYPYDQELRHFQKAGYLDREIEARMTRVARSSGSNV